MALHDIIRTQPGTAAELAAWLGETVAVESEDGRQTYRSLAERFGADAVDAADAVLKQIPGREWTRLALAGDGINLGTPRAKAELEQLRPALGDELTDALLSLGVTEAPRWQTLGLSSEPSEADVVAALDRLQVTEFPLRAVLVSVNLQASGQAAVSVRITPTAMVDGEAVTGTAQVLAFSGQGLNGPKAELLASILAAVDAYREAVSNG
jgi:hypothetical protein